MTHLVVDQLKFGYTERMIIDGVSLDLRAGEVLVLLGANGAGKSTLLKLIAGQITPESGSVFLNECDVEKLSRRKLAQQIALMPQHENQTSTLTVLDVVSLGRMPHCGWRTADSQQQRARAECVKHCRQRTVSPSAASDSSASTGIKPGTYSRQCHRRLMIRMIVEQSAMMIANSVEQTNCIHYFERPQR